MTCLRRSERCILLERRRQAGHPAGVTFERPAKDELFSHVCQVGKVMERVELIDVSSDMSNVSISMRLGYLKVLLPGLIR